MVINFDLGGRPRPGDFVGILVVGLGAVSEFSGNMTVFGDFCFEHIGDVDFGRPTLLLGFVGVVFIEGRTGWFNPQLTAVRCSSGRIVLISGNIFHEEQGGDGQGEHNLTAMGEGVRCGVVRFGDKEGVFGVGEKDFSRNAIGELCGAEEKLHTEFGDWHLCGDDIFSTWKGNLLNGGDGVFGSGLTGPLWDGESCSNLLTMSRREACIFSDASSAHGLLVTDCLRNTQSKVGEVLRDKTSGGGVLETGEVG